MPHLPVCPSNSSRPSRRPSARAGICASVLAGVLLLPAALGLGGCHVQIGGSTGGHADVSAGYPSTDYRVGSSDGTASSREDSGGGASGTPSILGSPSGSAGADSADTGVFPLGGSNAGTADSKDVDSLAKSTELAALDYTPFGSLVKATDLTALPTGATDLARYLGPWAPEDMVDQLVVSHTSGLCVYVEGFTSPDAQGKGASLTVSLESPSYLNGIYAGTVVAPLEDGVARFTCQYDGMAYEGSLTLGGDSIHLSMDELGRFESGSLWEAQAKDEAEAGGQSYGLEMPLELTLVRDTHAPVRQVVPAPDESFDAAGKPSVDFYLDQWEISPPELRNINQLGLELALETYRARQGLPVSTDYAALYARSLGIPAQVDGAAAADGTTDSTESETGSADAAWAGSGSAAGAVAGTANEASAAAAAAATSSSGSSSLERKNVTSLQKALQSYTAATNGSSFTGTAGDYLVPVSSTGAPAETAGDAAYDGTPRFVRFTLAFDDKGLPQVELSFPDGTPTYTAQGFFVSDSELLVPYIPAGSQSSDSARYYVKAFWYTPTSLSFSVLGPDSPDELRTFQQISASNEAFARQFGYAPLGPLPQK